MESNRWKTASLAINAIIRGLELDQVTFQYDELASRELTSLTGSAALAAIEARAGRPGSSPSLTAT